MAEAAKENGTLIENFHVAYTPHQNKITLQRSFINN